MQAVGTPEEEAQARILHNTSKGTHNIRTLLYWLFTYVMSMSECVDADSKLEIAEEDLGG